MRKTLIPIIAIIAISLILFGCTSTGLDIPGFEREDEGTFTIKIDETLPETIDEQTLNTLNNEIDTTNRRLATNEELNITRRIASAPSEINDGHTTTFSITFENTTNTTLENIEIIEFIPKEIIANASMITSNQPFTIIEEDPIIMFTISNLTTNTTTKINYTFNRTKNQGPLTQNLTNNIKSPTIILPAPNGTNLSTTTNTGDYGEQAEPYIYPEMKIGKACIEVHHCGDECVEACLNRQGRSGKSCQFSGKSYFLETEPHFNAQSPPQTLTTKCCGSGGAEYDSGKPTSCCDSDKVAGFGTEEYAEYALEATSICCPSLDQVLISENEPDSCCLDGETAIHNTSNILGEGKITTGACCESSDDELVLNTGKATGDCCTEEQVIVWGRGNHSSYVDGSNRCCGDTDDRAENLKAQYDAITNISGEPTGCCPTDTKDYGCGTGQYKNMCICCNEGLEVKRYTYQEDKFRVGMPYCAAIGSGSGSGASLGAIQQQVNPQNILDTYGLFSK